MLSIAVWVSDIAGLIGAFVDVLTCDDCGSVSWKQLTKDRRRNRQSMHPVPNLMVKYGVLSGY